MVQAVFQRYTQESVSINAIARELNECGVATRKGAARWRRSTVWAMLRNPAYMGLALPFTHKPHHHNKDSSLVCQGVADTHVLHGSIALP